MVFWDQIFKEISQEYPDVPTHSYLVDAASMFMVKDPKRFEVVVTSNLFGDILTDLGAAIAGGVFVMAFAAVLIFLCVRSDKELKRECALSGKK